MATAKKDAGRFLTNASTFWVTLVRLALILIPRFSSSASFMKWFYSPSFLSVLVRPHQSLSQIMEAHAVKALASDRSPTDFSSFYNANDSVRIPPLALVYFSKLMDTPNFELWLSLYLPLVDILISYFLERIGIGLLALAFSSQSSTDNEASSDTKDQKSTEETQQELLERVKPEFAHIFPIDSEQRTNQPLISLKSLPLLSAQLYYFSPFTALPSSLLYCWQNIPPLFLVAGIHESICSSSSGGSFSLASFYLAVATYLEPQHVAFLAPIALISSFHFGGKMTKSTVFLVATFFAWLLLLHGASCGLVGFDNYWRILGTVYGNTWLTTGPNLSLQWYFRMQIFSRFRDYFGAIFAAIPFIVIGPLCLRFYRYPWVLVSPLFSLVDAASLMQTISAFLTRYFLVVLSFADCIVFNDCYDLSPSSGSLRRKFCLVFLLVLSSIFGSNGICSIHCSVLFVGSVIPERCGSLDVAGSQQRECKLYVLPMSCVQCLSGNCPGTICQRECAA